jgi:thiosulfate/3-mercaptopyruvate sulfurtransferase
MPTTKRFGRKEFIDARIPDARFFDIDEISDHTTQLPHMLPTSSDFSKYVGNLGIHNNKKICIYDTNCFSAPRAYVMFKIFGHDNVCLLDGGFNKWKSEYPELIESGDPSEIRSEVFKSDFKPDLVKNFDQVVENIKKKEFTVIDARSNGRFDGTAPEPRPGLKSGHIEGSKNVFFQNVYNKDGTFKSEDDLVKLFQESDVDIKSNLVGSCGSGVTACVLIYALELVGKQTIPLYDGSWTEYGTKTQK